MACTNRTAPHQQFCTLSRFGFPRCRNYGYLRTPRLIILLEDCKRSIETTPQTSDAFWQRPISISTHKCAITARSSVSLLSSNAIHSRTCTIRDPGRWIPSCCPTSRHGMGAYCNWTGLLRSGAHYLTPFDASHVEPFGVWTLELRHPNKLGVLPEKLTVLT